MTKQGAECWWKPSPEPECGIFSTLTGTAKRLPKQPIYPLHKLYFLYSIPLNIRLYLIINLGFFTIKTAVFQRLRNDPYS
jgi:hypothetical protein